MEINLRNTRTTKMENPKIITHEWPFHEPFNMRSNFSKIRSTAILYMVGFVGKIVLNVLNRPTIFNKEILINSIYNRPKGVPLITVSNHESCVDDPFLISMFMTNRQLLDRENMRWTLAAHNICFTKPSHSFLFSNGKGIPTVRGLGVYQKCVDFAIDRLNEGNWLHIFPEGRVNMERNELYRFKWGVGRIISEIKKRPIVLPFYHTGMSDVLPNTRPYFPRIGKKIVLNVGKPIDLSDTFVKIQDLSPMEKRRLITDQIQSELQVLKLETLKLVEENGLNN